MRRNRIPCTAVLLILLAATGARQAQAAVYLSTEQALKLAFPEAASIERIRVSLTEEQQEAIEKRAHAAVRFREIDLFKATDQEKTLGYAMIHDVKGKARPITFMLAVDAAGTVQRVEILAYRESHGGEVRYPWFLKQFAGKSLRDPIRNQRDIQNISGATISCRSVADGVRTLLALWEVLYGEKESTE